MDGTVVQGWASAHAAVLVVGVLGGLPGRRRGGRDAPPAGSCLWTATASPLDGRSGRPRAERRPPRVRRREVQRRRRRLPAVPLPVRKAQGCPRGGVRAGAL